MVEYLSYMHKGLDSVPTTGGAGSGVGWEREWVRKTGSGFGTGSMGASFLTCSPVALCDVHQRAMGPRL